MLKKIAVLMAVCLLLCPFSALAVNDVAVYVNGEALQFDVPAQIINDRTMVPMRKIFETYGATVQWIESTQMILSMKGPLIIAMGIGSTVLNVTNLETGESKTTTLDSPPVIVEVDGIGRTLVPVRAISESLGKNVEWDDLTRSVLITDIAE